jgi:inosine-uridine nucleoside N-ribohydrolase
MLKPLLEFFYQVNFSRYGERGNFAMDTGVAVWLADCWPNGIVHARECLVTVDRPDLLRLDRRHNQAKSDHK